MAGMAGFEPTKCQSQSLVPYRLATSQYRCAVWWTHGVLYHGQLGFAILFCRIPAIFQKESARFSPGALCWHYLSSRQVTLQVLWARVSLTSVFGMGTGGPSPQSTPTSSLSGSPENIFIIPRFPNLSSAIFCLCACSRRRDTLLKKSW